MSKIVVRVDAKVVQLHLDAFRQNLYSHHTIVNRKLREGGLAAEFLRRTEMDEQCVADFLQRMKPIDGGDALSVLQRITDTSFEARSIIDFAQDKKREDDFIKAANRVYCNSIMKKDVLDIMDHSKLAREAFHDCIALQTTFFEGTRRRMVGESAVRGIKDLAEAMHKMVECIKPAAPKEEKVVFLRAR